MHHPKTAPMMAQQTTRNRINKTSLRKVRRRPVKSRGPIHVPGNPTIPIHRPIKVLFETRWNNKVNDAIAIAPTIANVLVHR